MPLGTAMLDLTNFQESVEIGDFGMGFSHALWFELAAHCASVVLRFLMKVRLELEQCFI